MDTNKKTARIVGALMLIATATYMLGSGLLGSLLTVPEFLTHIYPNRAQVVLGVLLEYIDAVAVVGIGVAMFPILKRHNEAIAISYVGTRIIECVLLFVAGISVLSLISLSQEYSQAGALDAAYFQTLGTLSVAQSNLAFQIAMLALGLGSIPFCILLYQSKLIPRALSVLGLIGYAALMLGTIAGLFGLINVTQGVGLLTVVPGGLFELIFPIWLFVKGFNSSIITSESAETVITTRDEMSLAQA